MSDPANTRRWPGRPPVWLWALMMACLAIVAFAPTEPRYEGIPLSKWLFPDVYCSAHNNEATRRAVQAMGTKAIPYLLNWMLLPKESKFNQKINALLDRQPWIEFRFRSEYDPWRQHIAFAGFAYLGEAATPAVPKLAALIEDVEFSRRALYALSDIGEPAVPVLLKAMNNPSGSVRMNAVDAICNTALVNHPRLLPRLLELIGNPSNCREMAAFASLRNCRIQPGWVGPVLARVAMDRGHRDRDRAYAIRVLHDWATNTDLTLPVFVAGISDPNPRVRCMAMEGLARLPSKDILIELLDCCFVDPDRDVRAKAVATLGRVTNRVDEATVRLRHALADPDPVVRAAAVGALTMLAAVRKDSLAERSVPLREDADCDFLILPADLNALARIDERAARALGYSYSAGCSVGFIPKSRRGD